MVSIIPAFVVPLLNNRSHFPFQFLYQITLYNIAISKISFHDVLASITSNEFTDDRSYNSSDPDYRDYLETMKKQLQSEWNNLGSDFEIICYDTPTNANEESKGPYTCDW